VRITLESRGEPVGAPFEVLPEEGRFEAQPPTPLAPGEYTVRASQADLLELEEVSSAPVEFTVVSPPLVTIAPIAPLRSTPPTFSGHAGAQPWDVPEVTLKIYAGAVAAGTPVAVLHVATTGESWTAGPAPAQPEGEYTAIAEQEYHGERPAVSATVTYFMSSPAEREHGSEQSAAGETATSLLSPTPVAPSASLTWIPATPVAGEQVSLVSTSLGGSSAIVSYAWDPTGGGAFSAGGPVFTTTFSSAGLHTVGLRVTDARGLSALAHATIRVSATHRALMQPFPVVRIAGNVTARGAKLRLLSVLAPPGARVTVRCRGAHCPVKVQARLVGVTATSAKTGMSAIAFSAFERPLRARTVLQIVVTRGNEIGKYTSFYIRNGRLPVRNDACVEPANPRPIACPTS
jgi:hypothetical protein